ncbi:MAG: transglutaminase-like cysteine peptidase [Sulfurimonas sp.]|nr:transglutaminase-like cysteine peptidase [Sulfurimonas sp.]MDQ7062160.1 transglutaminase-like cysteine peptidase [Sulfurimonas sp.]
MFKLFFFLCLPFIINAADYPHFSPDEFLHIEKSANRISKNRAMDYQKKVALFKTYNKTKQLNIVNNYLNQLLPQYDDVMQKKEDYWASPKEFLIAGYGDCEDYVIIKYFTLLKLGFNEKKLFITTVYDQYTGGYHMVLTYFKDKGKAPLVLDNLSFRVLDLKTRSDIKADIFINKQGVFKINSTHQLKKIANAHPMFIDLMKKVQKNH